MTVALTVFLSSLVLFIALAVLVRIEQIRKRRIVMRRTRASFDRVIDWISARTSTTWEHFVKYMVQLGWYYSIHSLLRALLRIVVAAYEYLETKFERNRVRAKDLKTKRRTNTTRESHLTEMAAHKVDTALTPEEEDELKERKLSESD